MLLNPKRAVFLAANPHWQSQGGQVLWTTRMIWGTERVALLGLEVWKSFEAA